MRLPRRRLHRTTFALAAAYNLLWGAYAAVDPQWLFRHAGMAPMSHPEVFATLGMVLALYGVLYLDVARVPEDGWLVGAVGLAGKILGPVGFAWLVLTGRWSPSGVVLILTNDLVWWIPFGLYLHDAWPAFRADLVSSSDGGTGH